MQRFRPLFCLSLFCLAALAAAQGSGNTTSSWQTLDGKAPIVVARGGFSGLFPDSSSIAYQFAGLVSLPNVIFWCDVQLTKDAAGICFPGLTLQNGSDIEAVFKNKGATYSVNGASVQGWFSVDFTLSDLSGIYLTQEVLSRSQLFDGSAWPILTVQEVANLSIGPGLWLNIQHDAFFSQRKLSMRNFTLSVLRTTIVDYISSPEVNFLRGILARKPRRTKLVFRFLGHDETEPSINQTYGSLLKNLTFIKTFASGILVPKGYIWNVDESLYLLSHTSVVLDAHKAGLKVFAADFANDNSFAYDFSYDPLAEYLNFIDNGNFSVDGVLSDFPITPSEAIDCFSHLGKNASGQAKPLVISNGGSSGDYAACTDKAYEKAITDGADVIDCPVQMTKDGIPICLISTDLATSTNAAQAFNNLTITIPELGIDTGIPTFSLTWSEIQNLTPFLDSPYARASLFRNPRSRTAGKLMMLSDFLARAKNASTISGVLIIIGNAAYLAKEQGLDVTDAVLTTLDNSSYTKTGKKVMIQSTNSSILIKVKETRGYELVYRVDETIHDADNSALVDIQKFANAVVISKSSVIPNVEEFLTNMTNVVQKLHEFNFLVYVRVFRNEFLSQAWDFLSDPTVEINTYVMSAEIDGVITEYPATAARYRRNRCLGLGDKTPTYMSPVQPGSLLQIIPPQGMPPAEAPYPVLTEDDVSEPPLPPVRAKAPGPGAGNDSNTAAPTSPSGQPKVIGSILLSYMAIFLAILALFRDPWHFAASL